MLPFSSFIHACTHACTQPSTHLLVCLLYVCLRPKNWYVQSCMLVAPCTRSCLGNSRRCPTATEHVVHLHLHCEIIQRPVCAEVACTRQIACLWCHGTSSCNSQALQVHTSCSTIQPVHPQCIGGGSGTENTKTVRLDRFSCVTSLTSGH